MDGFAPPAPSPSRTTSDVEALVRRYGDWLKEKLRPRYGDQADDLAQEALLRAAAHEAAAEVRHHKAFLLKIADNLAVDRSRRRQREVRHATERKALEPRSTPAIQEHAVLLKQIVLALAPELRDALVLTQIKGLTYREVATLRGVPERTVKDRVRRALAKTSAAMRD